MVKGVSKGLAQQIATEGLIMVWLILRIMERAQSGHIDAAYRGKRGYDTYVFLLAEALKDLKC